MEAPTLYRRCFLLSVILINIPAVFFILTGIIRLSWLPVGFWLGVLVLVWMPQHMLQRRLPGAFGISFAALSVLWWPLFLQAGRRLLFLAQNGWGDALGPSGTVQGFFFGCAMELIFFLPITLTMILGVTEFIRRNRFQSRQPPF